MLRSPLYGLTSLYNHGSNVFTVSCNMQTHILGYRYYLQGDTNGLYNIIPLHLWENVKNTVDIMKSAYRCLVRLTCCLRDSCVTCSPYLRTNIFTAHCTYTICSTSETEHNYVLPQTGSSPQHCQEYMDALEFLLDSSRFAPGCRLQTAGTRGGHRNSVNKALRDRWVSPYLRPNDS